MEEKKLWEKCVGFHGHECGGLAIGFKAALYARELLGLGRAEDEEVVCMAECDACPIDAIQVILAARRGRATCSSTSRENSPSPSMSGAPAAPCG